MYENFVGFDYGFSCEGNKKLPRRAGEFGSKQKLLDNGSKEGEVSTADTSDNDLFAVSLGNLANRSEEGIVGDVENKFFFSNFFNYSFFFNNFFNDSFFSYNFFSCNFFSNSFFNCNFFSNSFFNCNFFSNNFFNYSFFSNSFFNYSFFSNSFFNYSFFSYNFCDGSGSVSDEFDKSGDEFFGKFNVEGSSVELEVFSSDFDAAVQNQGNNFGSEFEAVFSSESNNCVYVNSNDEFFNNSVFFSNCFFSSNFFNNSGFFNDCFVNNSFFCHNCGSHCSAEKSCENERKSLLHFFKNPPKIDYPYYITIFSDCHYFPEKFYVQELTKKMMKTCQNGESPQNRRSLAAAL